MSTLRSKWSDTKVKRLEMGMVQRYARSVTSEVGVDGVAGEAAVLWAAEGVVRQAPRLLKVQDEASDLLRPDLPHIRGQILGLQESLQVGDAVGHNINGILRLPLAPGAEAVPLDQGVQLHRCNF
jgi:hypothetical protein